jgi:hypothetical protein
MRRIFVSLFCLAVGLGLGFSASRSGHVGRLFGTLRLVVMPRDPGLVGFFDNSDDEQLVGIVNVPFFSIPSSDKARRELKDLFDSIEKTSGINVVLDVDTIAIGDEGNVLVAHGRFPWGRIESKLLEAGFARVEIEGHPAMSGHGVAIAVASPYIVYGTSPIWLGRALRRHDDRDGLKPGDVVFAKLDQLGWRRSALAAFKFGQPLFGVDAAGVSLDNWWRTYRFAAHLDVARPLERFLSDLEQLRREAIAQLKESRDPDAPAFVKALERATLRAGGDHAAQLGIALPERLVLRLLGLADESDSVFGEVAGFLEQPLQKREMLAVDNSATLEAPKSPSRLGALRWEPFLACLVLLGVLLRTLPRRHRPSFLRTVLRPSFIGPLAVVVAGMPVVVFGSPTSAWLLSALPAIAIAFLTYARPRLHRAAAGVALGFAGLLGAAAVLPPGVLPPFSNDAFGAQWLFANAFVCAFVARAFLRTERAPA